MYDSNCKPSVRVSSVQSTLLWHNVNKTISFTDDGIYSRAIVLSCIRLNRYNQGELGWRVKRGTGYTGTSCEEDPKKYYIE